MLLCVGGGMQDVAAQAPPATDDRFAPAAERAQQEGDKVLKRILLNGAIHKRIGPPPAAEPAAPAVATPPPPKPQSKPAAAKAHEAPPARAAVAVPLAEDKKPTVAEPAPPSSPPEKPVAATAEQAAPAPAAAATTPPAPAPEPVPQDAPLVVLTQVEPDFPIAIVRRQKKGAVVMRFTVQTDGSVKQIEVVKTSNPFLNPAAMQALTKWKFQPPPREQSATVEMNFDLRQLSE